MQNQVITLIYQVKSFPIIFTLDPNALSPQIRNDYPRLVTGEVVYSPEYKQLSLSDLGEVRLNPTVEEYGTSGTYKEQFVLPTIANPTHLSDEERLRRVVQRNFEEQAMRSKTDLKRYRRVFLNVGFHIVYPISQQVSISPFMIVQNGVDTFPLIIRDMVSNSFRRTVVKMNNHILKYLFTYP